MASDYLQMNNAVMSDVAAGIQALSARAQERLEHFNSYMVTLPDAVEGQTLPAAQDVIMQARAYFTNVVDSLNRLAATLPAAIDDINLGDQYAAAAFSSGGLGGSTAV
jgi:uncharacterized protein YukE